MTYEAEDISSGRPRIRSADWANLILGAWLFVSTWVIGLTNPAAANAWVLGAVIFLVSISAIVSRAMWQEWANLALGAWTFVAPWVLAFDTRSAAWDHWIIGALVFIVALIGISARYGRGATVRHASGHR